MSSFTGTSGAAWSLRRAVDAMAEAARAAGRPGWIWVAGLGYPAVGAGLGFGLGESRSGGLPLPVDPSGGLGGQEFFGVLFTLGLLSIPFVLVFLRLRVGLARVAPPNVWGRLCEAFGRVRLRQAWRAGGGLTWSTLGLSLLVWLMLLLAVLAIGGPLAIALGIARESLGEAAAALLTLVLAMPALALLAAYSMVLSVLQQLALLSLAHNRRGVTSALVHAWRIARNEPWATGRTLAVDMLLNVTVFLLAALATAAVRMVSLEILAVIAVQLPLVGFLGVTRAGYWARAYRGLGGLSPDDRIPGLREGSSSWS